MREGPPLSPEVSALLDSEREAALPSPFVRARALARARAAMCAAEPVTRAAAPPVGRPTLNWAMAATVTSLASVAVGATAYHLASRWNAPLAAPRAVSPDDALEVNIAPKDDFPQQTRVEAMADPAAVPAGQRSPGGRANQDELRILRLARAAVSRDDFVAALRSIGDHIRRFPNGGLVEEREALHVKALAGLGRAEDTRRAAGAFRRRFPNSILLFAIDQLAAGPLRNER